MRSLIERHLQDAREGRLAYQQCSECGHLQAFVRPFCSSCGSGSLEWKAAAGEGRVVAITTLHRAPTPDYKAQIPYAIALVELAEGPRVMGHADDDDLTVGARVTLRFAARGERHLVRFDRHDLGART
jgi:uncharacterized protein